MSDFNLPAGSVHCEKSLYGIGGVNIEDRIFHMLLLWSYYGQVIIDQITEATKKAVYVVNISKSLTVHVACILAV